MELPRDSEYPGLQWHFSHTQQTHTHTRRASRKRWQACRCHSKLTLPRVIPPERDKRKARKEMGVGGGHVVAFLAMPPHTLISLSSNTPPAFPLLLFPPPLTVPPLSLEHCIKCTSLHLLFCSSFPAVITLACLNLMCVCVSVLVWRVHPDHSTPHAILLM